jgi:hypothetical protein
MYLEYKKFVFVDGTDADDFVQLERLYEKTTHVCFLTYGAIQNKINDKNIEYFDNYQRLACVEKQRISKRLRKYPSILLMGNLSDCAELIINYALSHVYEKYNIKCVDSIAQCIFDTLSKNNRLSDVPAGSHFMELYLKYCQCHT